MANPQLHVQVAAAAIMYACALMLAGCGAAGGGGGDATTVTMSKTTTTPTTTSTTEPKPYSCTTDAWLDSNLKNMATKGMAMDDTTMSNCSDRILGIWPNTKSERVKSLRLFAAWKSVWGGDSAREAMWKNLVQFVNTHHVNVMLGVDTTNDKAENEKQWTWGLELMKELGKDKILGFSFGNEMINKPGIDWDGYMTKFVQDKVKLMDSAGFDNVKITLIWSMGVLPRMQQKNFPFLDKMHKAYPDRWVWGVNPYSIWDSGLMPHSAGECQAKTDQALGVAYLKNIMTVFRQAVTSFTGNATASMWIGETGWATPFPQLMKWIEPNCPYYCSVEAFKKYYQMFLEWDGTLNNGVKGPDMSFYFTNRDADGFGGNRQPFGCMDTCSVSKCKIQKSALTELTPIRLSNSSDKSLSIVI